MGSQCLTFAGSPNDREFNGSAPQHNPGTILTVVHSGPCRALLVFFDINTPTARRPVKTLNIITTT